jgi:hypothetical protein
MLGDLQEQTERGAVVLRSLMRAQLRLALLVFLLFASLLGGLPLLFLGEPGISRFEVLGVPLPWVILGVGAYPLLWLLALLFVRLAEHNENELVDLVNRS